MELNALPYDVEVKKEIGETNRDSIDTQVQRCSTNVSSAYMSDIIYNRWIYFLEC